MSHGLPALVTEDVTHPGLKESGHPCDARGPVMGMDRPRRGAGSTEDDAAGTSMTDSFLRAVAHVDEVPLSGPAAELVGKSVGRYRVVGLLGRGGMGVVYLAEDESLHREVALKVLPADFEKDEERRRRLLREARAAAAVTHPNIAMMHEVGEAEGRLYIAMERVEGRSLRELLSEGRPPIHEVVSIARQVLRGLSRAHEAGFVHRDLKPDNIVVSGEGHVKILDFGLAKRQKAEAPDSALESAETLTHATATEEGRVLGTPAYMSPEQARGEAGLSRRSDIFSFGIVLYEMLAGKRPFEGATPADVITQVLRDTPPSLSSVDKAIPTALSRLVERCLVKAPEGRYADCKAILEDLEAAGLDGRPGRAAPPGKGRSAVRAAAAIGLCAVLAGGAAAWRFRPESAPQAPVSSASAAPAPRPTVGTDLPITTSTNPQAIAAYREGVQAQRDAAWTGAYPAFHRAVELDPSFAQAHLRLAWTGTGGAPTPAHARALYRKAISLRTSLGERDRALLDAQEPIFQRDPPDLAESRRRFAAAAARYPGDAELVAATAGSEYSPARKLELCEQCLALDPLEGDCHQMKAQSLARLGRGPEALQALERCNEASPSSSDCLNVRAIYYSVTGQCAKMEEDARRLIAVEPQAAGGYFWLATALRGLGRDRAAAEAAWEQGWSRQREENKAQRRRDHDMWLAALSGRFEEYEQHALARSREVADDPQEWIHQGAAGALVTVYRETGRFAEMGKVAEEYLARRDAWLKPLFPFVFDDQVLNFHEARLRAGSISREEYAAQRSAWIRSWEPMLPPDMRGLLWITAYALHVRTEDEAIEAVQAMPELMPMIFYDLNGYPLFEGLLGRTLALAGRPREALPHLERAVLDCGGHNIPFGSTWNHLQLGRVREALGDKDGACSAYEVVLDRWGDAKPRSVTAEKARAQAKALGCTK